MKKQTKNNTKRVRVFSTGANRDIDSDKLDFEGFYSPIVMQRFAEYMHQHRQLPDGTIRPSDNWQLGIPKDSYIKSAFRHFHDWWMEHRGYSSREGLENALCGVIFNAQGYLFEILKEKNTKRQQPTKQTSTNSKYIKHNFI